MIIQASSSFFNISSKFVFVTLIPVATKLLGIKSVVTHISSNSLKQNLTPVLAYSPNISLYFSYSDKNR
ncbi:hypothetical protein QUF55_10215 [Clostridiaceae bacterium HSG29]|nr:hypothetical protein [Clostridiaceae bacterium HSG29]